MSTTKHDKPQLSPAKLALIELKQMRQKIDALTRAKNEPIAIIGMGCRYPGGSNDPDSFWKMLSEGIDAITEVPADRWDIDKLYDPDPDKPGRMSTRYGGFLEHIDGFDADFFRISDREALSMDPQQRLLMEVCWEAMENAGQANGDLLESKTGLFMGISSFDYAQLISSQVAVEDIDAYLGTGVSHSAASGRISYFLGLQGPCLSIDTACSSSLVGLHYACQSLRNGECRMALAGGVNLILLPTIHFTLSKSRMMAPDGRCKAFDAAADGFVRSEGCGVVVLKRLSDALADKDCILALIRGSAVNQDGRSSGLTAPNGPSQQAVIRDALQNAGVTADEVQYVEAHGTGTALGDPIEVQALGEVYARDRSAREPLLIGSVKTNIGHAESAAGMAGLIKAILALTHGRIPPHLHLKKLNPLIDWEAYSVAVAQNGSPWPSGEKPRYAGVSSFGFSGTNAHIILGEAPATKPMDESSSRPLHVLTCSAPNEKAHTELCGRYARHLASGRPERIADLCHTANTGRMHFGVRSAAVVKTTEEALQAMRCLSEGKAGQGIRQGITGDSDKAEAVFLFTGQGAQYVDMGRQLFDTMPRFRSALEQCDAILQSLTGRSMLPVLFSKDKENAALHETVHTQPAVFSIGYALAEMWQSWGIKPEAVMGHSLGEYIAACVAGVFSLEDGLRLIVERARLMQDLPTNGAMAAVLGDIQKVQAALKPYADRMSISAVNDPGGAVISGETHAVSEVLAILQEEGIRSKPLNVSHAFHSPLMEPILERFERVVDGIPMGPPGIKLVSNVTGDFVQSEFEFASQYWSRHLRETVQFSRGIRTLCNAGYQTFIELGPHPVLSAFGRACQPDDAIAWLPSLRRGSDDWTQVLDSLSELYIRGAGVDWNAFDGDYGHRKISLPTYPFQRERYWVTEKAVPEAAPVQVSQDSSKWEALEESGERLSRQLGDDDIAKIKHGLDAMDKIALGYIQKALVDHGLFRQTEESHALTAILDRLAVQSSYAPLVRRWLDYLCASGTLVKENDSFRSRAGLTGADADREIEAAGQQLENVPLLRDYIRRSGEDIGRILSGATNPVEILFPGGALDTSVEIHQKWPLSSYYNKLVAGLTRTVVDHSMNHQDIRILEIGAGIGGLTSEILPAVRDQKIEYWYTDLSDFFLNAGRQRFGSFPFVRYACLDIETSPLDQGFGAHGFDVVIADNVLHPAGDVSIAVDHMMSLLKPGGILILRETTRQMLWRVVSFGFLEISAAKGRSGDLLDGDLGLEALSRVLSEKAFANSVWFPPKGDSSAVLPQHVMMAQNSFDHDQQVYVPADIAVEYHAEENGADSTAQISAGHPAVENAFVERLMETPEIDRMDTLVGFVREQIMKTLSRDDSKPIPRDRRLMDMGVDSLMAVEFRNRLKKGLGLEDDLPATLIYDFPTIEAIAAYLMEQVLMPDTGGADAMDVDPFQGDIDEPPALSDAQIEDISEEEMERLLIEKLDRMGTDT